MTGWTSEPPRVVCFGAHVLDVLARPVTEIPSGQGAALVDEIVISAAGTAGGTALVLSRLGAQVWSAGAIGADSSGRMLRMLLGDAGVDTSLLREHPTLATSASVLPIRPDGSRPALHHIGANGGLEPAALDLAVLERATHLHLGAPELVGGEAAAVIAERARAAGLTVSADLLAPTSPGLLDWIAPLLPHLDHLLPNEEQVLGLTGATELVDGLRALQELGVRAVVATRGADGAVGVDGDPHFTTAAYPVAVVDTTGCGDAFSAGYLCGLALGQGPPEASKLGCAVAALNAERLGTGLADLSLERATALVDG